MLIITKLLMIGYRGQRLAEELQIKDLNEVLQAAQSKVHLKV